jgi:hypothetical protein
LGDEGPRGEAKEERHAMEKGLDLSKTDTRPHAKLSPAVAAEAGIARAVAQESKLATHWVRDEGEPQEELPADAVAQILNSQRP